MGPNLAESRGNDVMGNGGSNLSQIADRIGLFNCARFLGFWCAVPESIHTLGACPSVLERRKRAYGTTDQGSATCPHPLRAAETGRAHLWRTSVFSITWASLTRWDISI